MKKPTYDKVSQKLAAMVFLGIAMLILLILVSIAGATPKMESWTGN
jgi:hypothetical protein